MHASQLPSNEQRGIKKVLCNEVVIQLGKRMSLEETWLKIVRRQANTDMFSSEIIIQCCTNACFLVR